MGERIDAIAIVAIIVLNSVLGFLQEYRAETAVAELRRMTAPKAQCACATEWPRPYLPRLWFRVTLLLVEAGELVTADARLIEEGGSRDGLGRLDPGNRYLSRNRPVFARAWPCYPTATTCSSSALAVRAVVAR